MEITKEQEERILALVPNFFKKELEVGKWYHYRNENTDWIMNYQKGENNCYGFNSSKSYGTCYTMYSGTDWIPATHKEIEKALISEAKKRGYKKGVTVSMTKEILDKHGASMATKVVLIEDNDYSYEGYLLIGGRVIFTDGIWAEIIETITK